VSEDLFGITSRVAELRRTFDGAFAEPVRSLAEEADSLLGLRVGPDRFAVRLNEVQALLPEPRIVSVPGQAPGLLGIAGLRNAIVPNYSLGSLLGQAATTEPLRWIIVVSAATPIGLAFEDFTGYLHLPRSSISGAANGASSSLVRESALIGTSLCGLISIRALVQTLERRIGITATAKET
jgi:chemotaxis signal transduction protein